MTMIADGTSVSTFLCTRKLGPDEVKCKPDCSLSTQIFHELTEVLFPHV